MGLKFQERRTGFFQEFGYKWERGILIFEGKSFVLVMPRVETNKV